MESGLLFYLYLIAGLLLGVLLCLQVIASIPALFTGVVNRIVAAARLPDFRFRLKGRLRSLGFIFFRGGPLRLDIRDDYLGYILRLDLPALSFRLNPMALLIGRVRVSGLVLKNPMLRVRVFRHRRKIDPELRPLPAYGRILLKGIRIVGGRAHIHDTTILTPLRLNVREIEIKGGRLDAGVPVSLFFLSREGSAYLDEAPINIGLRNGKGRLNIEGLDLRALAGIGSFLIREGLLNLDFPYELREKHLVGGEMDMRLRNFRSSLQSAAQDPPPETTEAGETPAGDELYGKLWEATQNTSEYGRVFPFAFDLRDFPGMFDQSLQGLLRRLFREFAVQSVKQPVMATLSSAFRGISSLFGKGKSDDQAPDEDEPRRGFFKRLFKRS